MSDTGLIIFAIVSLFSSGMSAIAGGGGGFIMTPLLIFLGLTPQQAIATGKILGLSEIVNSIRVLNKQKLHKWHIVLPLMAIAFVVGIVSPFFIREIEGEIYQKIIGLLILVMVPVVHYGKIGNQARKASAQHKKAGYALFVIALLIQGVFSSGTGMLVNIVFVSLLGMSALEASVTKRFTQILLNSVIVLGLLTSGLIVWKVAIVGAITSSIGGTVGAHMAVKKGNAFVMNVMKAAMLASGIALLVI